MNFKVNKIDIPKTSHDKLAETVELLECAKKRSGSSIDFNSKAALIRHLDNHRMWASGSISNDLTGFNSYQLASDVNNSPSALTCTTYLSSSDKLILNALAVREDLQGQGVGGEILDYLTNRAKKFGVKVVSLTVDRDNKPARSLYYKKGFVDVDESVRYISMVREI